MWFALKYLLTGAWLEEKREDFKTRIYNLDKQKASQSSSLSLGLQKKMNKERLFEWVKLNVRFDKLAPGKKR